MAGYLGMLPLEGMASEVGGFHQVPSYFWFEVLRDTIGINVGGRGDRPGMHGKCPL